MCFVSGSYLVYVPVFSSKFYIRMCKIKERYYLLLIFSYCHFRSSFTSTKCRSGFKPKTVTRIISSMFTHILSYNDSKIKHKRTTDYYNSCESPKMTYTHIVENPVKNEFIKLIKIFNMYEGKNLIKSKCRFKFPYVSRV